MHEMRKTLVDGCVVLDQAKMGALLSFLAAPLALGLARALGLRRTA